MRLVPVVALLALLYSCSPVTKGRLNRMLRETEAKFQDHTGFVLYDPAKRQTLYDYNGARYFTPASNTKIFTLFSGLKILADSVPALEYVEREDSLIFWGTGDPSFLYGEVFHDSAVYHFLTANDRELYFSAANFHTTHFGEGWAWDDYNGAYSAERSPFPIYGNLVNILAGHQAIYIAPRYFSPFFSTGTPAENTKVVRALHENRFVIHPSKAFAPIKEFNIPFRTDSLTFLSLLSDTLKRPVKAINKPLLPRTNILFSLHVDSLYRVMMQESDNFIAEQLLLMCANVLSDSLKPEIAIDFVKANYLKDLPDEPVWVDGSGLSRYNLFTPRSIVKLWEKILVLAPRERLFPLLATGGVKGTISNWYASPIGPYVFGKTGTLSNNHCLSGFLVTKKGRVLIFSFMNSNYTTSTNNIRRNMQTILEKIHERY